MVKNFMLRGKIIAKILPIIADFVSDLKNSGKKLW
jgi:hypothetical protein